MMEGREISTLHEAVACDVAFLHCRPYETFVAPAGGVAIVVLAEPEVWLPVSKPEPAEPVALVQEKEIAIAIPTSATSG
jgi:hypothetical protein